MMGAGTRCAGDEKNQSEGTTIYRELERGGDPHGLMLVGFLTSSSKVGYIADGL